MLPVHVNSLRLSLIFLGVWTEVLQQLFNYFYFLLGSVRLTKVNKCFTRTTIQIYDLTLKCNRLRISLIGGIYGTGQKTQPRFIYRTFNVHNLSYIFGIHDQLFLSLMALVINSYNKTATVLIFAFTFYNFLSKV